MLDSCRLCFASCCPTTAAVVRCFEPSDTAQPPTEHQPSIVADVLCKHFVWFRLQPSRDADAFVCQPCWHSVATFDQFYRTVLEAFEQQRIHQVDDYDDAADESITGVVESKVNVELIRRADADEQQQEDAVDNAMDNEDHTSVDELIVKVEQPAIAIQSTSAIRRKRGRPRRCKDDDDGDSTVQQQPPATAIEFHSVVVKSEATDTTQANADTRADSAATSGPNSPTTGTTTAATTPSAREYACTECRYTYTTANRLAIHRRDKHNAAAPAAVDVAESSAEKRLKRQQDDRLILRFMRLRCDECATDFGTFAELVRHAKRKHQQAVGVVWCCSRRFSTRRHALEHARWHENPQQYDCPTCGRNYPDANGLASHIERVHATGAARRRFLCDHCALEFPYNGALRSHMNRHHVAAADKRYECFDCHRRYSCESALRSHMAAHSTERPHRCQFCARAFKTALIRQQHLDRHHSGGPQQCADCGKWLANPGAFKYHVQRWHRAAKPVACGDCGFVAPAQRDLYRHRKQVHEAHTLPEHRCTYCERSFRRAKALRQHVAIHLGIDLYRCAYCPATFRFDSLLYTHRRRQHAAEMEADRVARDAAMQQRSLERAGGGSKEEEEVRMSHPPHRKRAKPMVAAVAAVAADGGNEESVAE